MEKQSFLQNIVSQITATVNQFAFNRLTADAYLDPEATLQDMRDYGDTNLGNYAFRTLFSHKKHSFI